MFSVIQDALCSLAADKVKFLVLRYDSEYTSNDCEVDILVQAKKKNSFVSSFVSKLDSNIKIISRKKNVFGYRVVLATIVNEDIKLFSLDIRDIVIKNNLLLADYNLFKNINAISNNDSLPRLKSEYEAAFLIARNYWSKRQFNEKHKKILLRTYTPNVTSILEMFYVKHNYSEIEDILKNCVALPYSSSLDRRSITGKIRLVKYSENIISLLFQKTPILALYGPDGTGKSTISIEIEEVLKKFYTRPVSLHYTMKQAVTRDHLEQQNIKTKQINEKNVLEDFKPILKSQLSEFILIPSCSLGKACNHG